MKLHLWSTWHGSQTFVGGKKEKKKKTQLGLFSCGLVCDTLLFCDFTWQNFQFRRLLSILVVFKRHV
jgi:hypothetical protein